MANYSYFQNFLERQIYIDLMFTIQTLYREFPMLDKQLIDKIESILINYYENNSNTRIKPRTVCAVLVYHFANRLAVTMSQTCKTFDINIAWFRKKRKDYIIKLGIENKHNSLNNNQYYEWRLFTTDRINSNREENFK